jgi:hypothetical protein
VCVKNAELRSHRAESHTFAVTNALFARVAPGKWLSFARTAKANLCGDRVAKRRLLPAPLLMPDPIGEKALVADGPHVTQRTMHAGGQEFLAHACQRRGLCSTEHVRRNG